MIKYNFPNFNQNPWDSNIDLGARCPSTFVNLGLLQTGFLYCPGLLNSQEVPTRSIFPFSLFFPSKKAEEGLVGPRCMCLACGTKQNTPSTHDFLKQGCWSEVVIETTAFITQRAVKPGWGSLFRDGGRKDANLRGLPLLLRQQALLGTKGTQHLRG